MAEKHPVNSPIAGLFVDSSKGPQLEVSPAINTVPPEPSRLHTFPEGGLKAHLTVLGAFIALMCTTGQLTAFGTFQAWYASHQLQHLPASIISWIGSLQLFLVFFTVRFFNSDLPSHVIPKKTALLCKTIQISRVLSLDAYLMRMGRLG